MINKLLPEDAEKPQSLIVSFNGGNRIDVMNEKVEIGVLPRSVFQKAFPAELLGAPTILDTPYAWPPLSTLSVYRQIPNRLFSSNDRTIDLSDVLTSDLREGEVAVHYLGVSSQSKAWGVWDENALRRIEDRIRYLFEFDGFGIDIERVSKDKNKWCSEEFVWKIEFWSGDDKTDVLYGQALAIVLKHQRASISLVQRHLRLGYHRAARLLEQMERKGLVSAMKSNGTRDLIMPEDVESTLENLKGQ